MDGGDWSDFGSPELRALVQELSAAKSFLANSSQAGAHERAAEIGIAVIGETLDVLRSPGHDMAVPGVRAGIAVLASLYLDVALALSTAGEDDAATSYFLHGARLATMVGSGWRGELGILTCPHGKSSLDGDCPEPRRLPCR